MPRFSDSSQKQRCNEQLNSVVSYFSVSERWEQVYSILSRQEAGISYRMLDFLVTTYSKQHVCQYTVQDADGQTRLVNIRQSAQTLLSGLHKRSLDPFRRVNSCFKQGGVFEFGFGDKKVNTTMAQLTFFRWALRNRVIDFARQHQVEIRAAMTEHASRKRRRPSSETQEIVFEFTTVAPKRKRSRNTGVPAVINAFVSENTVFTAEAGAS